MDIIQTKICILFALLISCLTAALIPFCCFKKHLKNQAKREIWQHVHGRRSLKNKPSVLEGILKPFKHNSALMLSSLNCFAGGIFLCTSFVELLPEVRHNFEEYKIAWSRSVDQVPMQSPLEVNTTNTNTRYVNDFCFKKKKISYDIFLIFLVISYGV